MYVLSSLNPNGYTLWLSEFTNLLTIADKKDPYILALAASALFNVGQVAQAKTLAS
jgi:hypothetical protein